MLIGVELETTIPNRFASIIGGYHRGNIVRNEQLQLTWEACYDCSINVAMGSNRKGCEFTLHNPIEFNKQNVAKLVNDINVFKNHYDAKVNSSCGVHVHVGWESDSLKDLRKLIHIVAHYEEAIYATTGTTRRESGRWSQTIRETHGEVIPKNTTRKLSRSRDFLRRRFRSDRYKSLNLVPLLEGRRKAAEFRAFSGSLNETKILGWIAMCVGIVENASSRTTCPKWDKPALGQSYRAEGRGEGTLERLFYRLGWWPKKKMLGASVIHEAHQDGMNVPSLKEVKKMMVKMAKKYDVAKGTVGVRV